MVAVPVFTTGGIVVGGTVVGSTVVGNVVVEERVVFTGGCGAQLLRFMDTATTPSTTRITDSAAIRGL